MTLKVSIVGAGNIGQIHAQIYDKNLGTKIVAVCDAIKEKSQEIANLYKCDAFTSVKDMISKHPG